MKKIPNYLMRYTEKDEATSQCQEYSPGAVNDDENLLRLIYTPEHVVNGEVIEAAIPVDDLKERGFSVDRENYAISFVIKERIELQKSKRPEERQEAEIARLSSGSVREIKDGEKRAFVVIDTALKDNSAHASIYSAIEGGRGTMKRLRSLLLPYLQNRYTFYDVFTENE